MADNTKYTGLTNYANYHTFSKLQVGNNVNFGGSINRSGHTVTNTDAWLDDVPFFNTFTLPSDALTAVGKSAVKNDLVSIAVAEGDIPAGIYRRNEVDNTAGDKTFTEIFTPYTIGTDTKDGAPVLLNKNGKAVVRVWSAQKLTLLTKDNNSNANSEGQAARIIIDGAPVEQFIAVPDVCRSGYPSNGYGIKVYKDASPMTMDFGTVKDTFFDVPFAGVIMFGGGTVAASTYTIDCFEYIGDKLAAVNTKISDIQKTIENLTIEAGEGIKQIKTGTGISVATEGVEGATALTPVVSVDTTVIATAASVKAVADDVAEIQKTIEEGVVSAVTASANAQAAGISVSEGTTPEIDITVGTVAEGENALVTGDAVASAISTAKSGAETTAANALSAAVEQIGKDITAAKESAIAAAKTETEGQIDTAKAAIKETTDALAEAIEAAQSAAEKVGTDAATQALTDAKAYTDTEIEAVEKSISDALTAHSQDIAKVEAAITGITTNGFERVIVSELPTTGIKLNAIYLVPMTTAEKELNGYAEYIYVGGTVTEGVVSGGKFEQIGTTKTDLAEYAKTTDVTETLKGYTTTATHNALDTRVSSAEGTIAEHATAISDLTQTVTANKTAADATQTALDELTQTVTANKTAADATQTALTGLTTTVGELAATVTANKTAADATQTALNELTQTVTSNKTAADATQTALNTLTQTVTANKTAADATQTALDTLTQIVTANKTAADATQTDLDAAEAKIEAIEGTLETLTGTGDDSISAKLATKVDNVTGSGAGISITTADTTDGARVATLTVNAATAVTENNTAVVTASAVYSHVSTVAGTTLTSAKSYTEEQIEALTASLAAEVTADNTSITVTQAAGVLTGISVTKGTITEKSTDLVDGGTVYAVTSALETAVSKKVDTETYTTDKAAIDAAIETAQETADSKIASVGNSSTHVGSALATTNGTAVIIAPATRWNASDVTVPPGIAKVINGEMFTSVDAQFGTIDDANLVDGTSMFASNTSLTMYVGDLGKLTTGTNMFSGCIGLTTFCGDLGSLTEGTGMFAGCQLDEESLIYIVDSLPTVSDKTITVGVAAGVDKAPYVTEAQKKGWNLA